MNSLRDDLTLKLGVIVSQYDVANINVMSGSTNIKLLRGEECLYLSMKRWHRNVHLSLSELQNYLKKVDKNGQLDVKENMLQMPQSLKTFLAKKFSKTNLKDKFSINEFFEDLLHSIRKLYDEKLHQDASSDDFDGVDDENTDVLKVLCGIDFEAINHYEKNFLPTALFYVYKEIHEPNYKKEEELMEDLFSIGSGSKTQDLSPEVVPVCEKCQANFSALVQCSSEHLDSLNKVVFKLQVSDMFLLKGFRTSNTSPASKSNTISDEEKGDEKDFNPFSTEVKSKGSCHSDVMEGSQEDDVFNPFFTDNIEKNPVSDDCDVDYLVEKSLMVLCPTCSKQFSRTDFLEYHEKIFHKIRNSDSTGPIINSQASSTPVDTQLEKCKVIPKFVDEGVDLMKTFDAGSPDHEEQSNTKYKSRKTNKKSCVRKVFK